MIDHHLLTDIFVDSLMMFPDVWSIYTYMWVRLGGTVDVGKLHHHIESLRLKLLFSVARRRDKWNALMTYLGVGNMFFFRRV